MSADPWIVVPNWSKFQHYRDRRPTWIKVYTELNSRADWLELSDADRGLLVLIWIEYARSNGRLRISRCPSKERQKHRRRSFQRLNDAGWIQLSASEPLAQRYPREEVLRTSSKSALAREPVHSGSRTRTETNSGAPGVATTAYKAAEAMTRNAGWQFPLASYRDELSHFDLDDHERDLLETLWQHLNDEADW